MAEITLETPPESRPAGQDRPGRKRPFRPRPGRKKLPRDHYRHITFSGKFNKPYHDYLMGLCAHLRLDSSAYLHRATVVLATAIGYEPPPPFDLVGSASYPRVRPRIGQVDEPATPELPGLTAGDPPASA